MQKRYVYKRFLLDLFYPNRCGFCGKNIPFDEYYCNLCGSKLSPPPENFGIPYADEFYAATAYDHFGRSVIRQMKKENNGYSLSAVSFYIYSMLDNAKILDDVDLITYIPMNRKDLNHRGYNQTKLIAKELTGLSGVKNAPLLKKIKETKEQKTLGAAERRKNLKNAFEFRSKEEIKGKTVLVIDDVCTTGSTLSEAARILKKSGAEKVIAAVFAKVVKKH